MQLFDRANDKKISDRILCHVELLQEMEMAGVPSSFLWDCPVEDLFRLSRKINQMEAKEEIIHIKKEAVKYLVHDQGFLPYLVRLIREENCEPMRVGSLLADAGEDILSADFSYEEVASVMGDWKVEENRAYVYLKYFASNPPDDAEKGYLMTGLEVLESCEAFSIGDLTDSERRLLLEPVISHRFLNKMIKDRGFWKRLENPEYRMLLNDLSVYADVALKPKQAEELWQYTGEIHTGLKEIIRHFPSEAVGDLLSLWLDNEALVYDLRRLKQLLSDAQPDMEVKFVQNRVAYLNFLYGDLLEGLDFVSLSEAQKGLLVYGITHKKKHFLTMVKEHLEDFTYLRPYHLLLDADTYGHYLNVNTLNPKNLKECGRLWRIRDENKPFLTKEEYTFDELKLLSTMDCAYIQLYHKLAYPKVDDRLRVIREVIGKGPLPQEIEKERFAKLGEMLSIKPLSKWRAEDMGHIEYLSYQQAVLLLSAWEDVRRFIPEIRTGYHADFLIHNLKSLKDVPDFQTAAENMLEIDSVWKHLNTMLNIGEEFLLKNQKGLERFLYDGGGEIFSAFLSGISETEWEKAKRLCVAEIAGRFREVKYYRNDLEREIALQLPGEVQEVWKKNMETKRAGIKLWEEDRLLPIMQIGEALGHTCLSYRNGEYKKCLLSCFDANKKVLFVSMGGMLVFRAIIRLTKGAFSRIEGKDQELAFADITQEETADREESNKKEYLTLFLERPYFKGISEDKEKEVVRLAVQMLQKKAKELQAELVLSDSYKKFVLEGEKYIRAKYYMYISASKNGKQYLDSLGGMAGVSDEGSYEKGYFLLQESFVGRKADKQYEGGCL